MIALFIYMLIFYGTTESGEVLVYMGAKFGPAMILYNEWWRLLTASFLHIGFEHIFLNGLTLYLLGIELEQVLGHWRFLLIFIISAIGGNLTSFAFSDNISAGASTAIFGFFMTYLVLSELYPDSYALRMRSESFKILIAINIVMGIILSGVDNWGHMGGAIYGSLATFLLCQPKSQSMKIKILYWIGTFITIIVISSVLLILGYRLNS